MQLSVTNLIIATLLFLSSFTSSIAREPLSSIKLTISNIRNDKGNILISLFNQAEGFPSDSTRAYRTYIIDAQPPSVEFVIENLRPGEYAIALVHDENQNQNLDTNLVGAPVEGYGATGANKRFSAPRFGSSKFVLEKESMNITIVMNYLF